MVNPRQKNFFIDTYTHARVHKCKQASGGKKASKRTNERKIHGSMTTWNFHEREKKKIHSHLGTWVARSFDLSMIKLNELINSLRRYRTEKVVREKRCSRASAVIRASALLPTLSAATLQRARRVALNRPRTWRWEESCVTRIINVPDIVVEGEKKRLWYQLLVIVSLPQRFLREIYSPWIVTLLVFDIPIKDSEKQRWKWFHEQQVRLHTKGEIIIQLYIST